MTNCAVCGAPIALPKKVICMVDRMSPDQKKQFVSMARETFKGA